MKWTKLDGFNQPNGFVLIRWDDEFDGKWDGHLYCLGVFANETFYIDGIASDTVNILQLMEQNTFWVYPSQIMESE